MGTKNEVEKSAEALPTNEDRTLRGKNTSVPSKPHASDPLHAYEGEHREGNEDRPDFLRSLFSNFGTAAKHDKATVAHYFSSSAADRTPSHAPTLQKTASAEAPEESEETQTLSERLRVMGLR